MSTQGLLLVVGQCEPDVPTKEFNDWYDGEHAPARLTVPGFLSATRYKAIDKVKPEWLAIYDLENPEVAKSPQYLSLREKASPEEKSLIPRLPILQRRTYSLITQSVGNASTSSLPGKYALVITWTVQKELEEDFNRWYDEEHMADVSKVPGWLRGRRYKLVDGVDLVPREGPPLGNYLVMHDFENGDYESTSEFQTAIETPWTKRIMSSVEGLGPRRYELHKAF